MNGATPETLVAFDPWRDGPPREVIDALPLSFWREQRVLPVAYDDGAILLASAGPVSDGALSRIRSATYRDVRRVIVADDEFEAWTAVALGESSWEQALVTSLQSMIRAIGLASRREVSIFAMPGRNTDVEVIARAFDIGEEAAVEVMALRARLPQVRLGRYKRPSYLATILPRETARELRVVPVVASRGIVVVATPRVPGPASRARLAASVGAELRVALCAPSAFGEAFDQVYAAADKPFVAPTEDAVYERLMRTGAVAASRRSPLDSLASVTTESRIAAAIRLGYVTASSVETARAHVVGLAPLAGAARVDRATAALARPELWRTHRCVPVARQERSVTVATDRELGSGRLELIRRVLGTTEVVARYVDTAVLDPLLLDLPPATSSPYTLEEHLLASGIVAPERAEAARKLSRRDDVPFLRVLFERGFVDAEDAVEGAAIAAGRPWLHVDRCSPEATAVDSLDDKVARAASAVPIARRGRSLLVAFLDPSSDGAVVDHATPLAVDPIFALAADPNAALGRWYAPRAKVSDEYTRFGRALVARGWLTRPQIDRGIEDLARGRPLDAVLTGRDLLQPDQLASALAAHLRIPVVDLTPHERTTRVVDALGMEREDVIQDDPVDHRVARLVPREIALRHGCIAVAEREGKVEVAFVDPLSEASRATVAGAIGRPIATRVATRRDVEVAQRRVYARPSVGERLIEVGIITREQLERALELHDRTGVRLGAALVALGHVTELELAATLAEQSELPFIDLRAARPDPQVARLVPPSVARERGVMPIWDDGEAIAVACTEHVDADTLRSLPGIDGRTVRPVIVTEAALDDALNVVWRDEYLNISAAQLMSRSPEDSARWVLSAPQRASFVVIALATLAGLIAAPVLTVTAYTALSTFFYLGFSAYKFYLAYRAMGTSLEIDVTAEDLGLLDDRELPVYTILVPVYHEARVFPILARALERLDYPKTKLDVKVLLEEDDIDTLDVARRSRLPSYVDLLVVPRGGPKGKPKACNYGLIHAKGEYVVIFDAEDIPEPDQLKKAVVAFRKGNERLACVQAKLNYFNRDQNLLTRWFTTEYSMWFDLFLPGLDASHAPIPLGGTSNHFPTARLRELGAWDPYNVTEDADLGMRLYKKGWTTAVIDSTTYEEANSEVYNWIRQRSRWVKGYIQTYLVHMRDPFRLYRQIGPKAFLSFQFVVGGTFFGYLVNPLYWLLTVTWFLFHWGIVREIFPAPVFYLGSIGLYLGNFAFTYLNVAGCLRREYYDMVKYALLSPVYWAFMSVAAWKGMLQLFYKPSYWEKTHHGLYRGQIRLRRTAERHAA